jgi:hypothetical protein
VPVDEIGFRDLQRFLQTDEAADQIQREVQMAGAAPSHDDALPVASDDECAVRMHAHRVVPAEGCCVCPVNGGVQAVEQTCRGQQTGARANAGQRRAGGMAPAQPGYLDIEDASASGARKEREVRAQRWAFPANNARE